VGSVAWSWNLIDDLRQMWSLPSMVNAYRAGTIVAIIAAVIGWFMVLRRQTFAGHTIALAGFPGAAGAVLIGVGASYGYFGFCISAAVVIAVAARSGSGGPSHESALTGVVQAFALACGMLFVSLSGSFLNGVNSLLFGSFLGITNGDVSTLAIVAAVVLAAMAAIGRPLLFASVDPDVASAEVSQITGSLLVFALLVMPVATAQRITARPALGLVLAVLIGLVVTWAALAVAYFTPYPIGFYVTTFGFGAYLVAQLAHRVAAGLRLRAARSAA
jgi:zinc/manganese transport system permease protein